MKKYIVYLLLFLLGTSYLFAEVVYLKDGCIMKGTVLEQNDKNVIFKSDAGQLVLAKEKIQNIDFSNTVKQNTPEKSDKEYYSDFFQQGSNSRAINYNGNNARNKNINGGISFFYGITSLNLSVSGVSRSIWLDSYANTGSKKANTLGCDLDWGVGTNSTIGTRIEYIKTNQEETTVSYYYNDYYFSGITTTSFDIYTYLVPIMFGYKYHTATDGFSLIFGAYVGAVVTSVNPSTYQASEISGVGSIIDLSLGMDVPLGSSVSWRSSLGYIYAPVSSWQTDGQTEDGLSVTFSGYSLTTGLKFKF